MALLVGPGHSQLRRAINLLGYWSEVAKSSEVTPAARATLSPTPWEPFHIYTHGDLVTRPGTDSPAAVYRAEGQTVYADPATPSARIVRALFGPTHGLQKTLLAVESALLLSC